MRRLVGVAIVVAVAAASFVGGRVTAGAGRSAPSPESADVGFLHDMIDHHDQAVLMAAIALRPEREASGPVRDLAMSITATQRFEIGLMEGWLRRWDRPARGGPGRTAMAWMGHGTEVGAMPGMATSADLQRLTTTSGPAFDDAFFELMRAHHEGGIHMGEAAAARADDADVRWLAGSMVRNQGREIREMEAIRERLADHRSLGG